LDLSLSRSSRPNSPLLRPSRLDPSFLWPDSHLPGWIRRRCGLLDRIRLYPLYSAAGAATMTGADACAATGLPSRAPRRPDDRRRKKVGLLVLFCCVALPTVDTGTSTPPEAQATVACLPTTTTSTSATSASRGYRLLRVHTGVYSSRSIRTLTTLRLWGISTCRLLHSASTPVPSCAVPPLRLRGDVRLCVRVGGPTPLLGCRPIRVMCLYM
jgi:hypothetical protein